MIGIIRGHLLEAPHELRGALEVREDEVASFRHRPKEGLHLRSLERSLRVKALEIGDGQLLVFGTGGEIEDSGGTHQGVQRDLIDGAAIRDKMERGIAMGADAALAGAAIALPMVAKRVLGNTRPHVDRRRVYLHRLLYDHDPADAT